jgi:hypothetical protein
MSRRGRPPKLYANLPQDFASDTRVVTLPLGAKWLFVVGRLYSSGELSDGAIPSAALPGLLKLAPAQARHADLLVRAGLWKRTRSGWLDVTFLETNDSRARRTRAWSERRAERS